MSYEQRVIDLLSSMVESAGGTVPEPLSPSNFQARQIQLLELLQQALSGGGDSGSSGTVAELAYSFSQSNSDNPGFLGSYDSMTGRVVNPNRRGFMIYSKNNPSIQMDLGQVKFINHLEFQTGVVYNLSDQTFNFPPDGLGFEFSTDGSTWVIQQPLLSNLTNDYYWRLPVALSCRYVRLYNRSIYQSSLSLIGLWIHGY